MKLTHRPSGLRIYKGLSIGNEPHIYINLSGDSVTWVTMQGKNGLIKYLKEVIKRLERLK